MVGVERKFIEHKIVIKPSAKEVKQKKRVQGGDRNRAINAEVAKLAEVGIVREAIFPTWIANPVMVRKQYGSWRMWIDFSDLNKACPKDCYPLPEIDQKVESLQGFKLKCFLDAYKRYHQILMSKEDEEKTAFYTDHGNFCYTKIPFSLKNAGATYQRLVDSIFAKQIVKNIEVYVDDMVIKNPHEDKMLQDIEETFRTLEAVKMKLNPAKCTFGVEEGQFLGYYVTRQGIQPSPTKVDKFIETPTLNSLRDAQGLNGKLTALRRFISKSADKAMPLFHTLKGCIEKSNFQWMNEAEKALQRIKEALHELPTLASPVPGETLQVYLSTSGEAISSVLNVEREGEQRPILLKPETSGRLAKWAIELREHDINYRPRKSIKGQALTDFLLEIPDGGDLNKEKVWAVEGAPADNSSWTFYTDEASSREGSGAGLILTSPAGEEVTYALRFDFHTSNNKAEYKVLLVGLRLAKQMGAKAVTALTDSRLAANQVNGSFEFAENPFRKWCTTKGISQRFTSVAHPQVNGQTEVSNRTIVNGIKKRLGKAKGNWAEEIPMVLWSYRTTPRTSTKETPFSLTYRTEAMLHMEVAVNTVRVANKDEESNAQDLRINLDILEEKHEKSGMRQAAYKHATERYYNHRVKEKAFRFGEYVLRKNEASRAQPQGKLGPTWEGPYRVTEANKNGAYVLETMEGRQIPRTWNARNLKKYLF
ncbi:uncharacterized protein LOC111918806 [Lactuca sativa]|uniref:uncharacterized protein LOC111918806 n=1 Tax=Lactuca sativa TaxID=4236 RepID=UPI0022AF3984|nr:uncharacterized protein LOC111918806 [Lactuca sativa]